MEDLLYQHNYLEPRRDFCLFATSTSFAQNIGVAPPAPIATFTNYDPRTSPSTPTSFASTFPTFITNPLFTNINNKSLAGPTSMNPSKKRSRFSTEFTDMQSLNTFQVEKIPTHAFVYQITTYLDHDDRISVPSGEPMPNQILAMMNDREYQLLFTSAKAARWYFDHCIQRFVENNSLNSTSSSSSSSSSLSMHAPNSLALQCSIAEYQLITPISFVKIPEMISSQHLHTIQPAAGVYTKLNAANGSGKLDSTSDMSTGIHQSYTPQVAPKESLLALFAQLDVSGAQIESISSPAILLPVSLCTSVLRLIDDDKKIGKVQQLLTDMLR